MKKIAAAAAAALVVAAVAVAAIAVLGSGSRSMKVHGAVRINENCSSAALDFPDISTGAQVVIKDSSGTVIATSALSGRDAILTGANGYGVCKYPFTVTVAPQSRYGIAVGRNRGVVWFNRAQMRKGPMLSLLVR